MRNLRSILASRTRLNGASVAPRTLENPPAATTPESFASAVAAPPSYSAPNNPRRKPNRIVGTKGAAEAAKHLSDE